MWQEADARDGTRRQVARRRPPRQRAFPATPPNCRLWRRHLHPSEAIAAATYSCEARAAARAANNRGETADLHGDARRLDHLVDGGESADASC